MIHRSFPSELFDTDRANAVTTLDLAPRPLRFTASTSRDELAVLDSKRSVGAWRATEDGACVFDARIGAGQYSANALCRFLSEHPFDEDFVSFGTPSECVFPTTLATSLRSDADLARCELIEKFAGRPLLVLGRLPSSFALLPHLPLPTPPPWDQAGRGQVLDELERIALDSIEKQVRAATRPVVWIRAIDGQCNAIGTAFLQALVERLQTISGLSVVVDSASVCANHIGCLFPGLKSDVAESAASLFFLLGGPGLPTLVASTEMLEDKSDVSALSAHRLRALMAAHDANKNRQAEERIGVYLARIGEQLPLPSYGYRIAGPIFALELGRDVAERTRGALRSAGVMLSLIEASPSDGKDSEVSLVGELPSDGSPFEYEFFFHELARALATAIGMAVPPATHRQSQTKSDGLVVRTVGREEADRVLDEIVALEERVYEPERRDPRDKLAYAFAEGGIAVIAEVTDHLGVHLAGCSLGTPLEGMDEVPGCREDAMWGRNNSVYTMATTLDPHFRGYGIGEKLKAAMLSASRAMMNPDGTPRYEYICGRMRIGATDAMTRINVRLGSYEVDRLRGQYGGSGEAMYYRLPIFDLRSRREGPARRDAVVRFDQSELPVTFPPALAAALQTAELESATVQLLRAPKRGVSRASRRAIKALVEMHPSHRDVRIGTCREDAVRLAFLALLQEEDLRASPPRTLIALQGDLSLGFATLRISHPAASLEEALAQLEQEAQHADAVAFEPLQWSSGRRVPREFVERCAELGLPVIAIERVLGRTPSPAREWASPAAIAWGHGCFGAAHIASQEGTVTGRSGDEWSLILATESNKPRSMEGDALSQFALLCADIERSGASIRRHGASAWVDCAAPKQVARRLAERGVYVAASETHLALFSPADATERDFVQLRDALNDALPP